jgi:lysozyme
MTLQLGAAGRKLIQSFEELRLTAYPDSRGIPTIGWGHTAGVKLGDSCTAEQADDWFTQDTHEAVMAVLRSVDVPLTQNQFDALVSFTFNVGEGSEAHSTLVRLLNAHDYDGAAQQFLVWDHVNGVVNAGLARRRAAEQALFLAA